MSNTTLVQVRSFLDSQHRRFPGLWWTRYLFHYADIENIVSILEGGVLFSRQEVNRRSLLKIDSAGADIIAHTPKSYLEYVRMYFRPRTPPLFHQEGFCTNANLDSPYRAHCPVPVYLLFDIETVLSRPDVKFSNGNLARFDSSIYSGAANLSRLDFGSIYHDTALPDGETKDRIVSMRCAEVIVPQKMLLEGTLAAIVCRSKAERETLISLLNIDTCLSYSQIIRVDETCFFRRKFYVTEVAMRDNRVTLQYSRDDADAFKFEYQFEANQRKVAFSYPVPQLGFRWKKAPGDYLMRVSIDNHIAFQGQYWDDLPF